MKRIPVVVADDHTLVRQSLVSVLRGAEGIDVVGEAADGLEAVERIRELAPRVAIIDISMPRLNGLEVVRRLAADCPQTRTLVLTMHEEDEYVLHVVRAGAAGYLRKDCATTELIDAVRQIAEGRPAFGAHAARVLAERVAQPERVLEDPYGDLTPREREVFHLVVEGLSTKQIARQLDISVKTAENHRAHMMAKIGAHNTAEVVRYAVRKGLMD